ncbi:MAG TPA: hypothetical protein VGO11_14920 [Chthoniobacteraceae bacterium]|jgi:hypothetical protein|nr:hypothetical protein [Chthoniobacteraceae bacterium]
MPQKRSSRKALISADEFDRKFDAGEDITEHLDFSKARVCPPLPRATAGQEPVPRAMPLKQSP